MLSILILFLIKITHWITSGFSTFCNHTAVNKTEWYQLLDVCRSCRLRLLAELPLAGIPVDRFQNTNAVEKRYYAGFHMPEQPWSDGHSWASNTITDKAVAHYPHAVHRTGMGGGVKAGGGKAVRMHSRDGPL